MTKTEGSKTQRGHFGICFCGGLLNEHCVHSINFAAPFLLEFSILCLDTWEAWRLVYYSAMTETGGSKTQRGRFGIRFCGGLLNEHCVHNINFAAPFLLEFSILCLDTWDAWRLVYYSAMAETGGSKTQRGRLDIRFCGGLLNEHCVHNINFAAPFLLEFSILCLDTWEAWRLVYYSAMTKTLIFLAFCLCLCPGCRQMVLKPPSLSTGLGEFHMWWVPFSFNFILRCHQHTSHWCCCSRFHFPFLAITVAVSANSISATLSVLSHFIYLIVLVRYDLYYYYYICHHSYDGSHC